MVEMKQESINGLLNVQQKLKASKDKKNNFGNYSYRNAEAILEALKPLLAEQNAILTIDEEIIRQDDHSVIKSTAIYQDAESIIKSSAFAGVDINRKGMDIAQSYGASSSYAKKYALQNLFAIDDSKDDPDTKDNRNANQISQDDKQRLNLERTFEKLAMASTNEKAKEVIKEIDKYSDNQLKTMIQKLENEK